MEMLPELQAERQLLAIEAASVPKMDQKGRSSVITRYERRIGGDGVVRAKSAHEALMQAGVSVVRVPTPKRPRAATGRDGTRRKGERG